MWSSSWLVKFSSIKLDVCLHGVFFGGRGEGTQALSNNVEGVKARRREDRQSGAWPSIDALC